MTENPGIDTQTTDAPPRTLATEIGFTADDLAANRAGELSERQAYTLRLRRRRSIAIGLVILLVVIFVATLFLFAGTREGGSVILSIIGVALTVCNAALMGVFARYWMRLTGDIQRGEAMAYTGELERVLKPVSRRVVNYMIRVEEAEVFVSKEAFELFEHEAPYTIYRAPYTGPLLSVERLER